MPQHFTPGAPSRARLQQGAGYVPQQPVSQESPIKFDGSTGRLNPEAGSVDTAALADGAVTTPKIADEAVTFAKFQNFAAKSLAGRSGPGGGDGELITMDPNNLDIRAGVITVTSVPKLSFGTGAPGGTPLNGELYFDDTGSPYVGYVGRGGAWHQF